MAAEKGAVNCELWVTVPGFTSESTSLADTCSCWLKKKATGYGYYPCRACDKEGTRAPFKGGLRPSDYLPYGKMQPFH